MKYRYMYKGPLSKKEVSESLERIKIKPKAIHDYDWKEKKFKRR